MALTCKYCGKEVKSSGGSLGANGNTLCPASPTKKHEAVSNPPFCVYCGKEVKPAGGSLAANGNTLCSASPTKKHRL
jgi:ribosomal protein L24E